MKSTKLFAKPLIAAMALAGLAAFALSGCDNANSKTAPAAQAGPPITAAVVVERTVNETQEFSGRLEFLALGR